MKTKPTYSSSGMFRALVLSAGLVTATLGSIAQDARFFRVAGPVATTLTEFRPDGTLVWINTPTNTTFIIQTATALGGASNWVDYVQTPATNGITTNRVIDLNPPAGMALIPAGSFTMGDSLDGSSSALPLHSVYVSAFYMDRYEVTKAFWDDVYQWAITHGYSFDNAGLGKAANHPVHTVSWYDVVKWCNARSEKEGRVPAYYTDVGLSVRYRSGQVAPYVNWNSGYRLPTESEWEKAARGGSSGQRFPWGNTISHAQANYYAGNSYHYNLSYPTTYHPTFATGVFPYTSPVGYFAANGYGLYDMAGNVWEWCWDWYGSYGSASQTDPRGPVSGSYRVDRGGSWNGNAFACRTAYRDYDYPAGRRINCGFRSVLPPGQ